MKRNEVITQAAREAGEASKKLTAWNAAELAGRKLVDKQCSEEIANKFVGVRIVGGRIVDVIANNAGVKIEE